MSQSHNNDGNKKESSIHACSSILEEEDEGSDKEATVVLVLRSNEKDLNSNTMSGNINNCSSGNVDSNGDTKNKNNSTNRKEVINADKNDQNNDGITNDNDNKSNNNNNNNGNDIISINTANSSTSNSRNNNVNSNNVNNNNVNTSITRNNNSMININNTSINRNVNVDPIGLVSYLFQMTMLILVVLDVLYRRWSRIGDIEYPDVGRDLITLICVGDYIDSTIFALYCDIFLLFLTMLLQKYILLSNTLLLVSHDFMENMGSIEICAICASTVWSPT